MKAKEFWENFSEQIQINQLELEEKWDLHSKRKFGETPFTKKIKEILTNVIKDKKPSKEFVVQTEYYNIDLVQWQQKKSQNKEKLFVENGIETYSFDKCAWNFDIAIEHENDKNLWMDEVIKLAYVFCNLRVVIAYFPYVKNGKEEMQLKYLHAITDTIKTLSCNENMKHGEFMIILGDVGGKEADGFKKLVYTPYLYNAHNERFEILR